MTSTDMHGPVPLLHDYLAHAARTEPDKVALVCGSERLTYVEIARRASALASFLAGRGVKRGDRVVVFADNGPSAAIAFFAALEANAVVCMVNPQTKADKLAYLLGDCRPSAVVADTNLLATLAEAAKRSPYLKTVVVSGRGDAARIATMPLATSWNVALAEGASKGTVRRKCIDVDLAAIVYTSGSTGDPKGVMLTHRNMLTAATSVSAYLGIRRDDVILCVLPLAFDYGLYQLIMTFRAGARLVLERSFAFPAEVLKRVVTEEVTGFPGVPTMFAMLAEMKSLSELDFSRIRFVTNTAAALHAKHITKLKELFPAARIYSMYGLTECKRCSYLPPEDLTRKPSSVGIAIPNTELWIIDEDGKKVGPGVTGQLVIRGATVMKGYWEKPDATARKLHPGPVPGEQVLHTGDYGKLDEEGYLYFVGRMDDVIKSRGEKVAPKEVENMLVSIPGIKEAAVIGVPDEVLGQAVKAFVVMEGRAALTERDVLKECQSRLESHMVPRSIVFLDDLPRTDTGKIKKTGLS